MANPQIEDGYCKISNELLDAVCKMNLSAYESRLFWFIVRRTYGFNKKIDRISYNQFEGGVEINRWHIRRTLNRLISRNIIIKIEEKIIQYGIQKDYQKWQSLPKEATGNSVAYKGYGALPKEATKSLPVEATTKDKRQYIKTGGFSFLPDCFDNELFKKSFQEFRDHRKSLKSKMTELAEKKLLNKLSELSNKNTDLAIEILDQSIISGWKGVFPLNNQKQREPEKIQW